MQSRNVESKQLGAWLFAGMTAPLTLFAGGMAWQSVALMTVICLAVCYVVNRADISPAKWLCATELVWLVVVLAALGRCISVSWPSGNVFPAVPLTLLLLGALSAGKGTKAAGRVGSVIFWLLALMYSVVVAAGLGNIEVKELAAYDRGLDLRLASVLLLPCLAVWLKRGGGSVPLGSLAGIGGWSVLVSVMVTGGLSLRVAMDAEMPLYQWLEGLNVLGVLQRFESLVSAALTMSWFSTISFVLSVAGSLADRIKEGSYGKGVWCVSGVAGIAMVQNVAIMPEVAAFCAVFMWVITPLLAAVWSRNKKFEIYENNA